MKKGKSPGWDGIPPEFYLKFWDKLGPYILAMFKAAVDKGSFIKHTNSALISLLLKKGKDPSLCSNYRPLSLITSEIKLYAKVLSNRLDPLMTKLIHSDQTGFVKSRLASDNIRRVLHIIDAAKDIPSPCSILSLDAQKAFDQLEWEYLWTVLEHMGLGSNFINMIKTLYANPSAMVLTSHLCSPQFPIQRSTCQGCPLSPKLFITSLEPLIQAIRQSSNIHPISLCNSHHKVSAFADDLLLYISRTSDSLPHISTLFNTFGNFSGYKINWSKSALMPLNSVKEELNHLSSFNIPIKKSFIYLGIEIHPNLHLITHSNFINTLKKIESDLLKWSNSPLSLQARLCHQDGHSASS